MTSYEDLIINVSNHISSLCYSVLRFEPYGECEYRCLYCYARWYRSERGSSFRAFLKLARRVKELKLKPIPARLSTLVEPFQPAEEEARASLKLLNTCLKIGYPMVVNTKSTLVCREPWRGLLKKMSENGLVVVQFSLLTLDQGVSRRLEPNAPSPWERLSAMETLTSLEIPVVLRLSPFIPGISLYPSVEELAEQLSRIGVLHVVAEALRLPPSEMNKIRELLSLKLEVEPYSFADESLVKVDLAARLSEYVKLASELERRGIRFATCKEGLFSLHTALDCCGFYLLSHSGKRATLYEVYLEALKRLLPVEEVLPILKRRGDLVVAEEVERYPNPLRKRLRAHERRMLRVVGNGEVLSRISPELVVDEGLVKARPIRARVRSWLH
ncbi:MAG: radical SAM protein [Candidatus Verstraetearchaeota archaeon]|nr:radical SAM protein [Candidatus Verstraetearchaeota archaeon]